ncbi:MAG: hypothetical protein D6742_17650 [Cyanobacteria bacterium J069]|nr:MAG: hypothetical protein D6742_17650 [Cyanobacteria bacterium J069]
MQLETALQFGQVAGQIVGIGMLGIGLASLVEPTLSIAQSCNFYDAQSCNFYDCSAPSANVCNFGSCVPLGSGLCAFGGCAVSPLESETAVPKPAVHVKVEAAEGLYKLK